MGTQLPPRKGTQNPPLFGPLCSGTVARLRKCGALVGLFQLQLSFQLTDEALVQNNYRVSVNKIERRCKRT